MKSGIAAVVCILILVAALRLYWRWYERDLAELDQMGLRAAVDRWAESGSPQGKAMNSFLEGRDYLIATNWVVSVGGSNAVTLFALSKPKAGRAGTLFVTTNKLILRLGASGKAEIVKERRSVTP